MPYSSSKIPHEESEQFVKLITGFRPGDLLCVNRFDRVNPAANAECSLIFCNNTSEEEKLLNEEHSLKTGLFVSSLKKHLFYYYDDEITLTEPSIPIMYTGSYFPKYIEDSDKSKIILVEFHFLIEDKKKILPFARTGSFRGNFKNFKAVRLTQNAQSVASAIEKFGKVLKKANER